MEFKLKILIIYLNYPIFFSLTNCLVVYNLWERTPPRSHEIQRVFQTVFVLFFVNCWIILPLQASKTYSDKTVWKGRIIYWLKWWQLVTMYNLWQGVKSSHSFVLGITSQKRLGNIGLMFKMSKTNAYHQLSEPKWHLQIAYFDWLCLLMVLALNVNTNPFRKASGLLIYHHKMCF